MRIICLGKFTSYVLHSSVAVLCSAGHEVIAVNSAPSYYLRKITALPEDFQPVMYNLTDSSSFLSEKIGALRTFIGDRSADLIYALWGRSVESEIMAILESGWRIPVVHALLCFPQEIMHYGGANWTQFDSWRSVFSTYRWYLSRGLRALYQEWASYRAYLPRIQGRIFASNQMLSLARMLGLAPPSGNFVYPDYLTAVFGPRTRLQKFSEQDHEPHIVYIGTPVFSGSLYDDVRDDLRMLADERVHVHFAEPDLPLPFHPYLHKFPAFDPEAVATGKLSDFMTQFDANLVLYHRCFTKRLRWRTTHPTRFLHGLLAGIPTVLPRGVFTASEEIVRMHGIGYSFSSFQGLAHWLLTPSSLRLTEVNSQRMALRFSGEANVNLLTSFFEKVA